MIFTVGKSMIRIFKYLTFVAIFAGFCAGAFAQQKSNPDKGEPLEITADESLEWHRNENFFQAKKNVKAVQGQTTLNAALLTAKYREGKNGSMEIYAIEADGSVRIDSAENKAYGDKATYDIDKGYAVMTGKNLKLVSPDQTVTARDRFEYWVSEGKLTAIGNAVAIRAEDRLEASKIVAFFEEDAKGQRSLKRLEAHENVVITTPTEVLKGDKAVYTADTNEAELLGNVTIMRDPNILQGERAVVDLNTNISRIFGGNTGKSGGGRVRGVFFPGSEEKTGLKAP